jgi:hypothetical protein
MRRATILLVVLAVAGCAAPPRAPAPAGFAMPASDETGAGATLAGFLLAQGWTVRLEESRVEATRAEERLLLEPLLDATGLDRIIVARTWPRAAAVDDEALASFARELTETLNVGQFFVAPAGLVLQTALPFLEELDPRLLNEFLAFTADVRLAVLQVQGERALLAPVEDPQANR